MQEKKHWGKLSHWAVAGSLSLMILLGNIFPVHAEEPTVAPTISSWSLNTLNEGEKYGIYPLNWYYDGAFQKPIDADKFNSLMKDTATKLDLLGFKKKDASLSFITNKVITRETVITSLHKLLSNYELPEAFGITTDAPVAYMQKKGLVLGTKLGLELENPATVEQAAVLASRMVEFTYDTANNGSEGLMWKVTKGNNTLYLLGSIHLGNTDMYPMHKSIREAFQASDDLWVELDIVNGDLSYLTEKMAYSDGTTLKDHVSVGTYEKLQKVLTKLELPVNVFDGYKPFAVTTNLSVFSFYDNPADSVIASATGIDGYFLAKAILTGKPIHELEGVKLQADLLSGASAEQQEKELNVMLDEALSGSKEAMESLKVMQLAWTQGDLEGMTKVLSTAEISEGEGTQILSLERDKNMAVKLAELLEREGEHTSFVVVGAAHYVIKGKVVDLLKEKGYTVQFMQ